MKIGIMTMWNAIDNYGGILQTYALQRYLRDQGHDAYDIRFTKVEGKHVRLKLVLKSILYFFHLYLRDVDKAVYYAKKRKFLDFRKRNINLSDSSYYTIRALQKNAPVADAYITGSDQVWARSLKRSDNERAWYLDFGSDNIKRIAYAVSFGHNYFPVEDDGLFKKLVSRFTGVSVRELNGLLFCEERGIKAERCIDSTFLLPADHYMGIASKRKYAENFAYLYFLNVETPQEIYFEEVMKLIADNDLKAICTTASGYTPAKEIYSGVEYDYATVEGWLSNILYSDIVFTTSFHGIVFSLLFKKQFIYMPLQTKGAGNDRVIDLLSCVELTSRIASKGNISQLMSTPILYDSLNMKEINSMIINSKRFLNKSLNYYAK